MPRRRQPPPTPTSQNVHYPRHDLKIVAQGDLTVTGHGIVTVDEPLKRSRALLVRSEEAVLVEFDPTSPPPPPCAGAAPDEFWWEVVEHRRQLFLRISWKVNTTRTILWKIFEVD